MFKNNNTMARSAEQGNNSTDKLNQIVEGTNIEGDIHSESNIRVDGKVKGTIETKGRVVIGPSGMVEGEVTCQNGDIEGTLDGRVTTKELLSLKSTSRLNGDIITEKLAIEPGAQFTGNCSMGGEGSKSPDNQGKGTAKGNSKEGVPDKEEDQNQGKAEKEQQGPSTSAHEKQGKTS